MSSKYCTQCKKIVSPSRKIGMGTFLLFVMTMGLWALAIPFYAKKCPQCDGIRFGTIPDDYYEEKETNELGFRVIKSINKLNELKEAGAISESEYEEKKKKLLDLV